MPALPKLSSLSPRPTSCCDLVSLATWSFWNFPLPKLSHRQASHLAARCGLLLSADPSRPVPQGQPSASPSLCPHSAVGGHAAHGFKDHHVLTPKSLSSSHVSLDSSLWMPTSPPSTHVNNRPLMPRDKAELLALNLTSQSAS